MEEARPSRLAVVAHRSRPQAAPPPHWDLGGWRPSPCMTRSSHSCGTALPIGATLEGGKALSPATPFAAAEEKENLTAAHSLEFAERYRFLGRASQAQIESYHATSQALFQRQPLTMAHDEPEHLCRCLTKTALGTVQPSLQQSTPNRTELTRLTPRGVLSRTSRRYLSPFLPFSFLLSPFFLSPFFLSPFLLSPFLLSPFLLSPFLPSFILRRCWRAPCIRAWVQSASLVLCHTR